MPISTGPKAQSIHEYAVPLEVSTVASSPSAPTPSGINPLARAGIRPATHRSSVGQPTLISLST